MWEEEINVNEVKEIRSKTKVFFGAGAIEKINDIAKEFNIKNINKLIIITGKASYKKNGAWDVVTSALKKNNIEYILFDKVTPNPNSEDCNCAIELAKKFGAKAAIGIGGGSPIDTAKTVAIMCNYPEFTTEDLFKGKFVPTKAFPIIAINTTHGTGTEVNRYAVMTLLKEKYKPAIGYDFCYPTYAIDDPKLMLGLEYNQTVYTSIDAISHVVEAATSKIATPYCIVLAKETIRLVHKYLPLAMEDPMDLRARYFLSYAAMIAGICFDNGFLHCTHALEHPLSGMKPSVIHGQGLGILLPSVLKHIYSSCDSVLQEILSPIGKVVDVESVYTVTKEFLSSVGMDQKLSDIGFTEEDIPALVELTFTTPSLDQLIGLSPIKLTTELVEEIYYESM